MNDAVNAHSVKRFNPNLAEPLRRQTDVVAPKWVRPRDHDIDPYLCPRIKQHRTSPTLPMKDIDVESAREIEINIVDRLRRTERQSGSTYIKDSH
jgi:hypothetical protein